MNLNSQYAIGCDVGGSHISCALVDMKDGAMHAETLSEEKVNNKATSDEILSTWSIAIRRVVDLIPSDRLLGIGFAMPGPFEYDTGVARFTEQNDKYEALYNVNTCQGLQKLLPLEKPIRFINDASAFAEGECWYGKGKGYSRVVCITLGTGFGSSFIENGVPIIEREDVPSEGCLWHLPYKESIMDDYISTRWFINEFSNKTGRRVPGVKEIALSAEDGVEAKEVFQEFAVNLGTCLGPYLKKFKAEVVVIGGNISGAIDLFRPQLKDTLKEQLEFLPEICVSELKENAAMIGAARLFDQNIWPEIEALLPRMK